MRPLFLLWGCLVLPGYGALVCPKEVSGFEGDTVSFRCTYGEEQKPKTKYCCQESGLILSRCSNTVYAETDGREKTVGKVSIQDSRHERALKITLHGVSQQDAGKYWCGIKLLGPDDSALISLVVFPGTSRPTARLDRPSAEDPSLVPSSSSSSSKPRMLVPTVRMLAPVLVLLALLLATGLAALGRCVIHWRKEVDLEDSSRDKEKMHLTHVMPGNSLDPECAKVNLAGSTEPDSSPLPPTCPSTEEQPLNQASEDEQASLLALQGDPVTTGPLQLPGFVPV